MMGTGLDAQRYFGVRTGDVTKPAGAARGCNVAANQTNSSTQSPT